MPTVGSTPAELAAAVEAASGAEREALILAALEHSAPLVRDLAVRLAARHVEPRVLGTLVADGANATRRNGAISALEWQGPYAVPYLLEQLASPDPELVMFSLQVLTRIGDPSATAGVASLVRHPDLNVAQAAIEALGRFRSPDAVPALLARLDGNLWLQLAAVTALGEIGDPSAVGPLLGLVPDSLVAEQAVRALQRIAAPESLGPLLDLLARVAERPLRDAILEAAGVVLDFHPDPEPVALAFGRALAEDGAAGELAAFLAGVLQETEAAPAVEPAVQAAAGVTLAARLAPLYPLVLRRAGDPAMPWVDLLWRQHARPSREELAALLAHADADVRRGALHAAAFQPDDLPLVRARLHDPDASVRAAACRALGLAGDDASAEALVARLDARDAGERAAAAGAVGRLGGAALDRLAPFLVPGAPADATLAALEALRAAGEGPFERELLALARAASPEVRTAALRALAPRAGSRIDVALVRALGDRDEGVQVEALELLVGRGGERTAATLIALLSAADSLRFRVIRALGRLRVARAAPKLEALYAEAPLHERVEIVRALTAIAAPGALEFLRVRLRAEEEEVRRVAAFGLADLAGPDELPLILRLAQDRDWALRTEAARGLGRLALAEGRAALLTLARDVEPVVARTARLALSQLSDGSGLAA
ncbi:MAG TPA: HEAT repeat domain-containing protein [Gemmatimonadales bacterium]|nr:HEAT repeat domain-containing protein [Gemmatimonadales bacterium]